MFLELQGQINDLYEEISGILKSGYAFFERERLRVRELKYLSSHIGAYKAPACLSRKHYWRCSLVANLSQNLNLPRLNASLLHWLVYLCFVFPLEGSQFKALPRPFFSGAAAIPNHSSLPSPTWLTLQTLSLNLKIPPPHKRRGRHPKLTKFAVGSDFKFGRALRRGNV